MRTLLSKMKRRLSGDFPRREVRFDEGGFSVFEEEEKKWTFQWSRAVEVFAYKIDLFAVDEICVGFRVDATGLHYWVSEEYVGYDEFVAELSRRYPGIRTDWCSAVAFPAFVQNRTTLWGEPWAPPQEGPNQQPEPTRGEAPRGSP